MRILTDVSFDIDSKQLVDPAAPTTASSTQTTLYTNNQYLMRFTLYNNAPTAFNLTGVTSFKLGIGVLDSGTPMVESANSQFISGDWASWSLSGGKICCRINTNSAALEAWLGASEFKMCYIELKGTDSVGESTLAMISVAIRNVVYNIP